MRTLLVVLGLTACAPALTAPERPWHELTSAHFTVTTDAAEDRARAIAGEFEQSYAALRTFMRGKDGASTIRVYAIENLNDYHIVRGAEQSVGMMRTRATPLGTRRMIVFALESRVSAREVFQHELVHHFVAALYPNAPAWLNEGLAQALSSASVEDDRFTFGRAIERYRFDGWQWQWVTTPIADLQPGIPELRELTYAGFYGDGRGYAGSWSLVHVLLFGKPSYRSAFEAFLGRLGSGTAAPDETFTASFSPELLAAATKDYLALPKLEHLPTVELPVPSRSGDRVRVRRLPPSEAFAMWGSLRPDTVTERPAALEDAERAIALDAKAPAGYLLRAEVSLATKDEKTGYWNLRGEAREERLKNLPEADKRQVLADLRRAVALDGNGVATTGALGSVMLRFGQKTKELDELAARVAAAPQEARDFQFLAAWEGQNGAHDRAIARGLEGVRRDPGCVDCYEIAAKAAWKSNQRDLSVSLQQRAINVAAESATHEMFERLRRYQQR